MKTVYLNDVISKSAYRRLESHVRIVDNYDHPEQLDAIIVRQAYCPREVIAKATKLKIIGMHGVGTDRIDMEAAREYGVPVVPAPGIASQSVAELAVTQMLALNRQLKRINTGLYEKRYEHFGDERLIGYEVWGKTLGLVGTGNIAKHVADMMRAAFAVKILCYNPHRTAEECQAWGFEKVETLEELFSRCDFVNVSVTLSDQTRNLINAKVLEKANPNLILVNTSRGGIVNERDLYDALTHGTIRGAASDVFDKEPPDPENPLLHLENFIATFHIGGSTYEAMDRVGNFIVSKVFQALGIEE
jgi:D-3-phosphoglycerate dehydrogenase